MKWIFGSLLVVVCIAGCSLSDQLMQSIQDQLSNESIIGLPTETEAPFTVVPTPAPTLAPTPAPPQPDVSTADWRNDMCTIKAKKGVIKFQTKDIKQPRGTNRDGGYEWMITRVNGNNYNRLLIMSMHSGRRDPARIIFARTYADADLADGRYPIPLMGVHDWEISSHKGALVVKLDGREVWKSAARGYSVSSATMMGYSRRGMNGKWRQK